MLFLLNNMVNFIFTKVQKYSILLREYNKIKK